MIEFVEYTGSYPNLCSGILVLKVDGKEYVFNGKRVDGELKGFRLGFSGQPSDYENGKLKPGLYNGFWSSGGSAYYESDTGDEIVEAGPWEIHSFALPDELKPYAEEIGELFNTHVPWGCCGGCL